MPNAYQPFRNIKSVADLELFDDEFSREKGIFKLSLEPYYAEICLLVNVRCEHECMLFSGEQTLAHGTHPRGGEWKLALTEYGYLRFAGRVGEEQCVCESALPVHAVVDSNKECQLGFSFTNYAWVLRDTGYAAEAKAYSRISLLASNGARSPLSVIGEISGQSVSEMLAPVPEKLRVGSALDGGESFAGAITRARGYNTSRHEVFASPGARSARGIVPVIRGGGGFEPRWVADDTIEVFTRPEFCRTSSYWVFLKVRDSSKRLKRLRVWTMWYGGVNMTPTFFWSPDRREWTRIVPALVEMDRPGYNFRVEFEITEKMAEGGFLASAPPFADEERVALLKWAEGQPHTSVREIGKSVEGRPLHLIRVGTGQDGPGKHGVAVICGQHSPLEMMTGRVIQPLIERLLRRPDLLEACNFYFVPTVNVDCAYYGGNGMNADGKNTNRHWFTNIQPENRAVIDRFDALASRGQSIDFALDMHAGGIFKNHVLMSMGPTDAHTPSDDAQAEEQVWIDLLERHAGLRRKDGWPLGQQKLRASDYFQQVHGATGFCLEMSTCSYFDPVQNRSKGFDMDAFQVLAEGFAKAFEERFCG